MYVRKKHNRSGTTSVVIVSKASGKYKEIKSFGTSSSDKEIEMLCDKAAAWIRSFGGQQELDFDDRRGKEIAETERVLSNIDKVLINGTQLLLEQVYNSIGFNRIPDEILRHLALLRQPRRRKARMHLLLPRVLVSGEGHQLLRLSLRRAKQNSLHAAGGRCRSIPQTPSGHVDRKIAEPPALLSSCYRYVIAETLTRHAKFLFLIFYKFPIFCQHTDF